MSGSSRGPLRGTGRETVNNRQDRLSPGQLCLWPTGRNQQKEGVGEYWNHLLPHLLAGQAGRDEDNRLMYGGWRERCLG